MRLGNSGLLARWSCPAADRWLSGLGERAYVPGKVVPLSLHVAYRDYLGGKDPYAQARFAGRQRKLTQAQKLAFVYTPQVLVQGRDFRDWRHEAQFQVTLERINGRPARAHLFLEIEAVTTHALHVRATARLERAPTGDEAVYLAAYENRLGGAVTLGGNNGRFLSHDFVVLEWLGPFSLSPEGLWQRELKVALLPRAASEHSGVAAFIQDRRSLEVLQALMLPACHPER